LSSWVFPTKWGLGLPFKIMAMTWLGKWGFRHIDAAIVILFSGGGKSNYTAYGSKYLLLNGVWIWGLSCTFSGGVWIQLVSRIHEFMLKVRPSEQEQSISTWKSYSKDLLSNDTYITTSNQSIFTFIWLDTSHYFPLYM
jgi:hypothetical protein